MDITIEDLYYQRSEQFTAQFDPFDTKCTISIYVHNSETLCYFRAIFRPVVHNGGLKDFLMDEAAAPVPTRGNIHKSEQHDDKQRKRGQRDTFSASD